MLKNKRLEGFKNFILDLFFPKFCLGCGKEGSYLCEDCKATIEIFDSQYCLCEKYPQRVLEKGKCEKCQNKHLNGLYSAVSYENILVKELIKKFKYQPFVKEMAKDLFSLLNDHFALLGKNSESFKDFLIIPVPLDKKRKNWRGYNQAEELAKELSFYFKIPLIADILIKTKKTAPQVELNKEERKKNLENVFCLTNQEAIKKRKILLVDDVYTTGATLEECAKTLKRNGAKEVWGVTVARETNY
jgi:competence protein ComFC